MRSCASDQAMKIPTEAHAPRGHCGHTAGGVPCAHARLIRLRSSPQAMSVPD